jgi:hypothetical protein
MAQNSAVLTSVRLRTVEKSATAKLSIAIRILAKMELVNGFKTTLILPTGVQIATRDIGLTNTRDIGLTNTRDIGLMNTRVIDTKTECRSYSKACRNRSTLVGWIGLPAIETCI